LILKGSMIVFTAPGPSATVESSDPP
jgi:hypothetical protein